MTLSRVFIGVSVVWLYWRRGWVLWSELWWVDFYV